MPPAARLSARVHTIGTAEGDPQVQPVPLTAVAVNPMGSVSVTVTVPSVAPTPIFLTVIVNVSPVSPDWNAAPCVLTMVKSGGSTLIDAVLLATPVPPL